MERQPIPALPGQVDLFGAIVEEVEPEPTAEEEIEPQALSAESAPGEYASPVSLTSQFRFCGNPLRADTYRGCSFGCKYCFANARTGPEAGMFEKAAGPANLHSAELMLKKAYAPEPYTGKDTNVECLRRRVPLHLGGMSDPFQQREFKEKNTVKFLQLTEQYKHPILISSKTDHLLPEHWDLLNPERHAFQVSLIGMNAEWLRKWETGTPSPADRIAFMVELKGRGFWVGLRIQPLIDIEEAIKLVQTVRDMQVVDYITVEHLKMPMDNKEQRAVLVELMEPQWKGLYVMVSRSAEMRTSVKARNLERIKEAAEGIPVGAGDNDLHHLSDSRCCCGIDTIGPAFDRYIKYNSSYFLTAPAEEEIDKTRIWRPTNAVSGCFIGTKSPLQDMNFTERVEDYIEKLEVRYEKRNRQMSMEEFLALEEGS